MRFEDILFVVS